MSISFAITTHNEKDYIKQLIERLLPYVGKDNEIVILDDYSDSDILDYLKTIYASNVANNFSIYQHPVKQDFGIHKNILNEYCKKDWILQLDADELVSEILLFNLPTILNNNSENELFWLPRVNTVTGLTLNHIQKWKWPIRYIKDLVEEKYLDKDSVEYEILEKYSLIIEENNNVVKYYVPLISWPDWQGRLYRNIPDRIKWNGSVHEKIIGFKSYAFFPDKLEYAIIHKKDITRQETQNKLYEEMLRPR